MYRDTFKEVNDATFLFYLGPHNFVNLFTENTKLTKRWLLTIMFRLPEFFLLTDVLRNEHDFIGRDFYLTSHFEPDDRPGYPHLAKQICPENSDFFG